MILVQGLTHSTKNFNKNIYNMRSLLYIIAVILVIGWAFGFFYAGSGNIIHVLLVIAIIALLLGVIRRA